MVAEKLGCCYAKHYHVFLSPLKIVCKMTKFLSLDLKKKSPEML